MSCTASPLFLGSPTSPSLLPLAAAAGAPPSPFANADFPNTEAAAAAGLAAVLANIVGAAGEAEPKIGTLGAAVLLGPKVNPALAAGLGADGAEERAEGASETSEVGSAAGDAVPKLKPDAGLALPQWWQPSGWSSTGERCRFDCCRHTLAVHRQRQRWAQVRALRQMRRRELAWRRRCCRRR